MLELPPVPVVTVQVKRRPAAPCLENNWFRRSGEQSKFSSDFSILHGEDFHLTFAVVFANHHNDGRVLAAASQRRQQPALPAWLADPGGMRHVSGCVCAARWSIRQAMAWPGFRRRQLAWVFCRRTVWRSGLPQARCRLPTPASARNHRWSLRAFGRVMLRLCRSERLAAVFRFMVTAQHLGYSCRVSVQAVGLSLGKQRWVNSHERPRFGTLRWQRNR
jgi:hypothetical protein